MGKQIIAIVPAAGLGTRFHKSEKKTFTSLLDLPLLVHTLKRLHQEDSISEIIPALREEDISAGTALFRDHNLDKVIRIAPGGQERQDSIRNALHLIKKEYDLPLNDSLILIHDGVRPLIPHGTIKELLSAINGVDGVAPGIPAKDTLKEVGSDEIITSTIDRAKIRAIQTPQIFPFPVISKAYDLAYKDNFYATDDTALVEKIGGRVRIIPGNPYNIKITTPEDLQIVACLLQRETRN